MIDMSLLFYTLLTIIVPWNKEVKKWQFGALSTIFKDKISLTTAFN